MIRIKIIFLTVLFLFPLGVYSQKFSHRVSLEGGYSVGALKNFEFSPMSYSRSNYLVALGYSFETSNAKDIFSFNAQYDSGKMITPNLRQFDCSLQIGSIRLDYFRSVMSNKTLNFYVGGGYQSDVDFCMMLNDYWGSTFSFLATHSLNFNIALKWQVAPRHRLSTSLSVPVVALLVQPPYNNVNEFIYLNQNNILRILFTGKVASWNQFFRLNYQIGYIYSLSRVIDLTAHYELAFYSTYNHINSTSLDNRFRVGAAFKF